MKLKELESILQDCDVFGNHGLQIVRIQSLINPRSTA